MSKTITQLIAFIAAIVVIFVIGQRLVADHVLPTLGEFIASSTAEFASSTVSSGITASSSADVVSAGLKTTDLSTPNGKIHVMIADTDASRSQGLSDRPSLAGDAGMLFVFDSPGQYGFWMKDMAFPLDLVWIGADKKVVSVTKGVSPATYPEIFNSPMPISYVLEINSGSADKLGIIPGVTIDFDLPKS